MLSKIIRRINWGLAVVLVLGVFLRVWKLGAFPPGLYSDETVFGYNDFRVGNNIGCLSVGEGDVQG